MLKELFPRERDFFPVFDQISACLLDGVTALTDITTNILKNGDASTKSIEQLRSLELQAEKLARQTIEHLHATFITPFDRTRIFQLVVRLGEVLTLVRITSEKIKAYEIKTLPEESVEIAEKCGEVCQLIQKMVAQLRKMNKPNETVKLCMSLYQVRSQVDVLSFKASQRIYSQYSDIRTLLQMKEVKDDLVSIIMKCEEISFLIEEIILEYA